MRGTAKRLATAATAFLILGALTACGGGDDPTVDSTTSEDSGDATPEETTPEEETPAEETPAEEETAEETEAPAEDLTAMGCNGVNAQQVADITGVTIDQVSDVSVDTDVTCLFGALTEIYGATVSSQSVESYMAGDLAGLSAAEAATQLGDISAMFLSNAEITPITAAGGEAVLVLGDAMTGGRSATAAALVAESILIVTVDGSEIADIGASATAILDIAAGAA